MVSLFKKKSFIVIITSLIAITATSLIAFLITSKITTNDKKSTTVTSNKVSDIQNTSEKIDIPVINNTSDTEKSITNENKSKSENKPTTETKSNSQASSDLSSKPPVEQSKKSSSNTNENSSKPQCFTSKNLEFAITFPDSWKDKYSIVEKDDGITVYFKPKNKVSNGTGMFFKIVKKSPSFNENTLDSIPGIHKYFNVKNTTFVIGGPTDISFPDDNPEFNSFKKLKSECPNVLKTLKAIN